MGFNEKGEWTTDPPLVDVGQSSTLDKLRALASPSTWMGAAQSAVGIDPKAPVAPPVTPDAGKDPMLDPGGGISTASTEDANVGSALSSEIKSKLIEGPGGVPQGPSAFYRPEGTNTLSTGGPGPIREAFESAPSRMKQAMYDQQSAREERNDALSKHYDKVAVDDTARAAANAANKQKDQEETQIRQEKLEKATQFYTQDLADTGKFWSNPGNIISAIAYSLMPIFGGDPTAGAKLINQAVQSDMANRQHAADQTLGALSSNLAGYRKLAGDRQSGDLLAEAEAHRMASQEIARIGAKFESKDSRAQMQALIADQDQKTAVAYMQAHKLNWYQEPKKMDKGVFDARAQGVEGGYAPSGAGGVPNPYTSAPPVDPKAAGDMIGGAQSVASTKKNAGFSSPQVMAHYAAARTSGGAEGVFKASLEGRIPGGANLFNAAQRELNAKAVAEARRNGNPNDYEHYRASLTKEAEKALAEASPRLDKMSNRNAQLAQLQSKIDIIMKLEAKNGRDPDKFIDSLGNSMPKSWVNAYRDISRQYSGDPQTESAKQDQMREEAKAAFRQQLAGSVNTYVHDHAGGAVSPTELANMQEVIRPGAGMNHVQKYINSESIPANADYRTVLDSLGTIPRLFYVAQKGTGFHPLDSAGRPAPIVADTRKGYDGGTSSQRDGGSSGGSNDVASKDPRVK